MKRNYPTVRLVRRVTADIPFLASVAHPGKPPAVALPGEHRAYMNHYGAVSVLTPGGSLGVKPAEFAWVHGEPPDWGRQETAARRNGCCWTPEPDDHRDSCPVCHGRGYSAPERRIAFRAFKPEAGREVIYGPKDAERMHTEVADALESTFGEIITVDAPVEMLVYERREIDESAVRSLARNLVDWWAEQFSEEYGGESGEGEDGSNLDEAVALVNGWAARAQPWQCEPTGEVLVLDQEDLAGFDFRPAGGAA